MIGVIAVLIGLLLPAVQKTREAAARVRCLNNLKQIGLACHQYHTTHGTLPPGVTSRRSRDPYPEISWLARLLPYLEQQALWQSAEASYDLTPNPYLHPAFSTPVAAFQCPSDERVTRPQFTHDGIFVALTSYLGCSGTDYIRTDGVLYRDSHVRLTDIPDGMANTLQAGERPPSADFWYGWWYSASGFAGTGVGDMLLGVRELSDNDIYTQGCPKGPYHFTPGKFDQQCDLFHYWSPHPGGAHFLFCDGSVRFLSYSADALLPALATRAGAESAQVP